MKDMVWRHVDTVQYDMSMQGQSVHECSTLCLWMLQAIEAGEVKSNFKGVALGDSWISPIGELIPHQSPRVSPLIAHPLVPLGELCVEYVPPGVMHAASWLYMYIVAQRKSVLSVWMLPLTVKSLWVSGCSHTPAQESWGKL